MADQMADLVVCVDPSAPCCPASPGVDQIPGVDAGSQQEIAVALRRHKHRVYMKAWRAKRKAQIPNSIEEIKPHRRKQRIEKRIHNRRMQACISRHAAGECHVNISAGSSCRVDVHNSQRNA